mgnify:CR=1 FL=1
MEDPTDQSLLETALRETEEEIFIPRSQVQVLGSQFSFPNHKDTIEITPFLGYLGHINPKQITFNPDEVHQVFTLSFEQLSDPSLITYKPFRESNFKIPVFHGGPQEVWGITAFITQNMIKNIFRL